MPNSHLFPKVIIFCYFVSKLNNFWQTSAHSLCCLNKYSTVRELIQMLTMYLCMCGCVCGGGWRGGSWQSERQLIRECKLTYHDRHSKYLLLTYCSCAQIVFVNIPHTGSCKKHTYMQSTLSHDHLIPDIWYKLKQCTNSWLSFFDFYFIGNHMKDI